MNSRPESSKLVELRSKTDRQLVQLLHNRLESGLHNAQMAADAENHWSATKGFLAGERVYNEVSALLPWVENVTRQERRRLELELDRLRVLLADSSTHAGQHVQTACS
jgi:hypothetical protein